MSNHVHIRYADEGSDTDADTVARRGRIAGKMIATVQIEEGVPHSCVIPDDIEAREVFAFAARDFAECTDTLDGDMDAHEDKRELAATKRVQRQRREAREVEAKEREAAEARARANS
jgi:hypothetical protein